MSALVLFFALGVFLVYDAWTRPAVARSEPARHPDRLARLLVEAGLLGPTPGQLVAACVVGGLTASFAVVVVVGSPAIAVVALAAGVMAPLAYLRGRRTARRRGLREAWPAAVELLAGAVRAGDTLPAAVGLAAERGPESLRDAFGQVVADHRVSGNFVAALGRLGDRLADPTADRVVLTLTVAHRVGGQELGRVLRTLAAFLREDLAVRKEIEARQSWTIVAARVAAAAPWLVLLLVASHPEARRAFDSVGGLFVLAGGAAATIVGYRLMLVLGRLPDEPRVLGGHA